MSKKWSELYEKIPTARRERIENHVQGMIARFGGKPLEHPNLDWRNGWGEADQMILGEQVLARERSSSPAIPD